MNKAYLFGKQLTKENYTALRKLAQNLSYKDFHSATGFAHGIHNRLRKFSKLDDYKKYIEENRRKYPAKQLKDNKRHDLFTSKYYYLKKGSTDDALAKGILLDGKQFLVFGGSRARLDHSRSYAGQRGNLKLRRQLRSEKIVFKSDNNRWLIFKRPYLFNSPSQAASLILGNLTNGWDVWKDIDGNKLNQERS